MKDITNKIFEAKQGLATEVQNEYGKDYSYQTFAYENGKKKFDYGFLAFNGEEEFYSITAFNEDSEDAEQFASDFNLDLEEVMELKIGETISDHSHGADYAFSIVRIW